MTERVRSPRPPWFRRAPYHTVRWTVPEAKRAIGTIVTLWKHSDTRPMMLDLWALLCRARAIRAARVTEVPWETAPSKPAGARMASREKSDVPF
jgi:hypothetical protein